MVGAKLFTLNGENVKKCIRIRVTVLEIVIWGGNCQFYGHKLHSVALLARRLKTKFCRAT